MNKIFLICTVFFTLNCQAQKLEKTKVDKFSGARIVQSEKIYLRPNMHDVIVFSVRGVDSAIYLALEGTFGVGPVGIEDPLILLLENHSQIKIYPVAPQSTSFFGNSIGYAHIYKISRDDLKNLSQSLITSMRRQFETGHKDIDLKEKWANQVKKLATLFLTEFVKS